ncbi:RNA polymerase sigma factor [Paraliomyxa miuraensis]|uniref:RNA polymerase sigma factor n=1 Tax=Paraliomyxa miuraensis TaxID=376150 RepID=UPI002254EFAB|nr:sigma-70 family RNA polymerase sigma factor [Paraliomyxa miuraensis]MCX4242729.1 sigma-70 family RNA polymerase sigma factor [Paraliomyxa miuraensis]
MDQERAALEEQIRGLCEAGQWGPAATTALRGYGPEVLGYLSAMCRTETDAAEVFSSFCEDLWKGLPGFRWHSSFRTWAYTLARHALYRLARDPQRRRDRIVALSDSPEVLELAEQVRTTTMIHLRTETKNKFTALRDQLEPDDRTLLILRVDRKLAWNEIASIMADEAEPTLEQLKRGAATLRKRFERAKERLRKLAIEQRLIPD